MLELDETVKNNLKNIKRIIGIYSGKGGVGKTTIAINIAVYLADRGFRVCLLDADIDCPNIVSSLGLKGKLELDVLDNRIIPAEKYKLKIISMASLQESDDEAIVWRGPMLTNTLMHFLGTTIWGSADYLIIDLPPGTSDVPLTIMKFLQPDGIVLVTTPRSIAEIDARKSANLAKMTDVKILGVIENMSGNIFGSGKGEECAKSIQTQFLGKIDFDEIYLKSIDEGYPAVLQHKNAYDQFSKIVSAMRDSEEKILGSKIKEPKPNLLTAAKNLSLDFKDQFIDRYKNPDNLR